MSDEQTPRERVLWVELERAIETLERARERLDEAQVEYDVARERFVATKQLAAKKLSESELDTWQDYYPAMRYFGYPVGEAIGRAMVQLTIGRAKKAILGKKPPPDDAQFRPSFSLEQIVHELELGGFEFHGAPSREVNASLINHREITKIDGLYMLSDQATIDKAVDVAFNFIRHGEVVKGKGKAKGKMQGEPAGQS